MVAAWLRVGVKSSLGCFGWLIMGLRADLIGHSFGEVGVRALVSIWLSGQGVWGV